MARIRDALGRLWHADPTASMIHCDGRWVSWGEVRVLSERITEELSLARCARGGRVAVVLDNRVESVAAMIALILSERTLVTLSPLQPVERISEDLAKSGVAFVLAPESLWSQDTFVRAVADLDATGWSVDGDAVHARTRGTHESVAGDADVLIEMMTSGTTGAPKRIPLTTRQLEASLASALRHAQPVGGKGRPAFSGSVAMVTLPIVHIGGLWSVLQALVTARRIVMLERFNVDAWHAAVKEHRPALAGLPPAAMRSVLDADLPRSDLDSLRAINAGTSPVDPALVDAFYERYGIPTLIVYGATEFAGAVAGWTMTDFHARWTDKKGSVGRPFPGIRLRIVDENDTALPTGVSGRLQVSSPQLSTPEDSWVTTSDLAHLDEDGFLYIDGRADDVILRGGFKVAPEIVVRALRSHDAVADAAVAGLADARLGQIPVAAVELRPGASATPDELRAHCRSTLTPYEVPADVYVVDELPRGAALKVDRRRLMSMVDGLRRGSTAS
jgi:long-chain acyl-CoA synthetase